VNKLSGANTDLICQLAEKLLTTVTQDIRVASYFSHSSKRCWVCAASASGATWLALINVRTDAINKFPVDARRSE
jgi:predicted component of type VI protein secretion system